MSVEPEEFRADLVVVVDVRSCLKGLAHLQGVRFDLVQFFVAEEVVDELLRRDRLCDAISMDET